MELWSWIGKIPILNLVSKPALSSDDNESRSSRTLRPEIAKLTSTVDKSSSTLLDSPYLDTWGLKNEDHLPTSTVKGKESARALLLISDDEYGVSTISRVKPKVSYIG